MERYQGKKVVIIGGTSGMGLATAKMLLDGGARVLVTGRSQAGLESAQKELGKDALVVSSDARSLTEIDALASRVKAEFDTFDLLFVNAGFSIQAPLESITEAVYDEMFNLNAKGPLFAVQKLTPLINRGGSIVLTTSIANVKGMPGNAAYGAAKAALRSFARTLAAELLSREIRVNAVTPGPIDTPIIDKVFTGKDEAAQMREKMIGMIPMKRWGRRRKSQRPFSSWHSTRPTRPAPSFRSMGVGRNSEVIRIQGPHLGEEWNTVTAAKVIIQQLETSLWLLTQSISDLSDDHWTHIPGDGLPCAAWIVGHALLVDRQVLEELEELEAPLLRAAGRLGNTISDSSRGSERI